MKQNVVYFAVMAFLCSLIASCEVEFSPNAEWKDVPSVYCVMDPDEDTVWARVQRCYLGQDGVYGYSSVKDSTNYKEGDIRVELNAWKGIRGVHNGFTASEYLVANWTFAYAELTNKDTGIFHNAAQPMYYAVVGNALKADTDCVFQLLVISEKTGDTLAQAYTNMVGYAALNSDAVEQILLTPNNSRSAPFGFRVGCRGEIKWNTLPRARIYQPFVRFYYKRHGILCSVMVPCNTVRNTRNTSTLSTTLSQDSYTSYIKGALQADTAAKRIVNNVDILINCGNEDLNAYIMSRNSMASSAQDMQSYTNIDGGVGIFASRRTHICVNVPCDSNVKQGYLSYVLHHLGVGLQ